MFEDLSCFVPRPLHLVDSKKRESERERESKMRCAGDVLNLLLYDEVVV